MIRINFAPLISRCCTAGLALLGFGCSSGLPDEPDPPQMYGTLTAKFEIKGMVSEAENKTAVPHATVKIMPPDMDSSLYMWPQATTDAEGKYEVKDYNMGREELKVVCIPSDDTLEADSTLVKLDYSDTITSVHAEATVNFELKKKQSDTGKTEAKK